MGALGSKHEISQLGVVYGFNYQDFAWKDAVQNVYRTNAVILEIENNKYVLTTRSKIIYCRDIIMYYSCFHDSVTTFKANLHVIFQSFEYNIVVLATKNQSYFDTTKNVIVDGDCGLCNTASYKLVNTFVKPTSKTKYNIMKLDANIDTNKTTCDVELYDAKFNDAIIYDESYLPSNYFYRFEISDTESDTLNGINGTCVFNNKHTIIGMVSFALKHTLYVLPYKTIHRVLTDFVKYKNNIADYMGVLTVPITLNIESMHGKPKLLCKTQSIVQTSKKNVKIKPNDELIKINNIPLIIKKKMAYISDPLYNDKLQIDVYVRLHLTQYGYINLKLLRDGKLIDIDVLGSPLSQYIFNLTASAHYYPNNYIPHIDINGIIIVQLTHELIDICFANKFILGGQIINKTMNNDMCESDKYLIVIDCLNHTLVEKYNLPCLKKKAGKQEKHIQIPYITTINNECVNCLEDILHFELNNIHQLQIMNTQLVNIQF